MDAVKRHADKIRPPLAEMIGAAALIGLAKRGDFALLLASSKQGR